MVLFGSAIVDQIESLLFGSRRRSISPVVASDRNKEEIHSVTGAGGYRNSASSCGQTIHGGNETVALPCRGRNTLVFKRTVFENARRCCSDSGKCFSFSGTLYEFGNVVVQIREYCCSDSPSMFGSVSVARIRHRCPARVAVVQIGNVYRI